MVIKEISKLVLKRGTAVIYDDPQRQTQWISRRKMMEQVDPETGEVVEED